MYGVPLIYVEEVDWFSCSCTSVITCTIFYMCYIKRGFPSVSLASPSAADRICLSVPPLLLVGESRCRNDAQVDTWSTLSSEGHHKTPHKVRNLTLHQTWWHCRCLLFVYDLYWGLAPEYLFSLQFLCWRAEITLFHQARFLCLILWIYTSII